ncbi:MAG: HD domain-containing protein [Gammaproteobacteria bacterium]|nr:HD domain-containing protein [Gammaproteobacteria bacterium]
MMTASPSLTRAHLHYLVTLLVIGIYGVQVCPFIESLTVMQLAIPIILIVSLQYLLRSQVIVPMIDKADYKTQVKTTFRLEWLLFLASGILLTAYNSIVYGFPAVSGLKVLVGFLAIGFFVAIDLALERELVLSTYLREQGDSIQLDKNFFTLVAKFSLFSAVSILFLVSVFFLLINKDLEWLAKMGEVSSGEARRAVFIEFAFVGVVLLGYTLLAIRSYARNLNFFFNNENRVLNDVSVGHLDRAVSVCSNDEFGIMAHRTNTMIRSLKERTEALQKTQDITFLSLASLAETRDNETGAHILRTQHYVKALAIALRGHPKFEAIFDDESIEQLHKSAPLHDIGKVGIPDAILLKPGKLDEDEFEIMKTHAQLGSDALKMAEAELGDSSFLRFAREIAASHHEKWDGSGYPAGLAGESIPVSGRLMAVADVYDALISKRVYKPAFDHDRAMEIIKQGRGVHFDPDIVDALFSIEDEVKAIAARYSDAAYGH